MITVPFLVVVDIEKAMKMVMKMVMVIVVGMEMEPVTIVPLINQDREPATHHHHHLLLLNLDPLPLLLRNLDKTRFQLQPLIPPTSTKSQPVLSANSIHPILSPINSLQG